MHTEFVYDVAERKEPLHRTIVIMFFPGIPTKFCSCFGFLVSMAASLFPAGDSHRSCLLLSLFVYLNEGKELLFIVRFPSVKLRVIRVWVIELDLCTFLSFSH